jgi:MFS family permease
MSSLTGVAWLRGSSLLSAITSICSSAFLLFGYDQGVMSGVVISSYWLSEMGNPSTIMVSTITAMYSVGGIFGSIAVAFTTEKLGRKRSLIFGSVVIIIGAILMGTCVERVQMIVGRITTGFGRIFLKCFSALFLMALFPRYWILNLCRSCVPVRSVSPITTWLARLLSSFHDAFRSYDRILDELRVLFPSRHCTMAFSIAIPDCLRYLYYRRGRVFARDAEITHVAQAMH